MSHEVSIYGAIWGAKYRYGSEDFRKLQRLNEHAIRSLPRDEDWPYLDMSIFSLPGPRPIATYREQLIHFGLTLKDDPNKEEWIDEWLEKFEAVLRRLYWYSAELHLLRDFHPIRVTYTWKASAEAGLAMRSEFPEPISDWERRRSPEPS